MQPAIEFCYLMQMKKIILFIILAFVSTVTIAAQDSSATQRTIILGPHIPTRTPRNPPPGNIRLLEGYTNNPRQGIDSIIGDISKSGGLLIRYDIGESSGFYTDYCNIQNACQWSKKQIINNREVRIGLTAENRIIATFPQDYANFFADTNSPEDVSDFLLMILTYKVSESQ